MKSSIIVVSMSALCGLLLSCNDDQKDGAAFPDDPKLDFETIGDRLALLNGEDGIDEFEAGTLAMAYYLRFEGREGGIHRVYRRGASWIAETIHRDYVPKDIEIDAQSGRISHEQHPTLEYPWKPIYENLNAYGEGQTALTKTAEQGGGQEPPARPE